MFMPAIILIGYRGVGKSTIASEIVHKLSLKQDVCKISLDEELAKKIGNLQAFVKANGWDAFRDEETKLLKEFVLPKKLCVIDCGGGIVEKEENVLLLKKLGQVFYIKASVQTIQDRLQTTHARLSLSGEQSFFDEIKNVLERREPLYLQTADVVIESDSMSIAECAQQIIAMYS
jgi:shikimate kinase